MCTAICAWGFIGLMKSVVIIGAGLGGLLTGAYMAKKGFSVKVFEKLAIPGGRFTHFDYQGFSVPSGAFHAFPGGGNGPLARSLRTIGIEVELIFPQPAFMVNVDGDYYPLSVKRKKNRHTGLRKRIGLSSSLRIRMQLVRILLRAACNQDQSIAEVLHSISAADLTVLLFDHLTKFSLGVSVEEASATSLVKALFAQRFSDEGILRYGNRALIEKLSQFINKHGGEICCEQTVERINIKEKRAESVLLADGRLVNADIIISNAEPAATVAMLGEYAPVEMKRKAERLIPAYGAAHSIRSRQPLFNHRSIDIPLQLAFISGIIPISELTAELSPSGWHYALAYQWLDRKENVAEQLAGAQQELTGYLGRHAEVFNSAVYYGNHPAATVSSCLHQQGDARFAAEVAGLENIFLVGQHVQGNGIAAEIIGDSCAKLWRKLS